MLTFEIVRSDEISLARRVEIVRLLNAAYREDVGGLFATLGPATHILAVEDGAVTTHAMWITRWLQPGERPPLKTAYVEMVATLPRCQGRGLATFVMNRLVRELPDSYALAALCPARSGIYERLGWWFWRGPLSIRLPTGGTRATPDERVMVHRLPQSPPLDLTTPLSAEWRDGELW
jgi:aminoglycoside 2'-N-acetyltransferase I